MRFRLLVLVAATMTLIAANASAQLRVQQVAAGFKLPVAFVQDPVNRNIQYVVQQNGHIRTIQDGVVLPNDFIDLSGSIVSGGEQGLLGMAFPPDTASNGRFFVYYTNTAGNIVVARLKRTSVTTADPSSLFPLRWNGPSADAAIDHHKFANHNGGNLVFGPDGFLYIGVGDGGSGNDPDNNAQNPAVLLGKMLRVDVSVSDADPIGYRIPPLNPFLTFMAGTRPEIWSFGLRNPWRFNFDDPRRGGSGALLIGDVGQNLWEEIDYEPPNTGARNYGWRYREGAHNNVTSIPPAYGPLIEPIHEYGHDVGSSVTGGFVYRGLALPTAVGRYFFADFVAGRVWSLVLQVNPTTREATAANLIEHTAELSTTTALGNISSFGVDTDGELHIVSYSTGRILKIVSLAPKVPTGLRIVGQE